MPFFKNCLMWIVIENRSPKTSFNSMPPLGERLRLELRGGKMGVRAFAKNLSVSPSTVSQGAAREILQAFRQRVDFLTDEIWGRFLQDEYFLKKSEKMRRRLVRLNVSAEPFNSTV